MVTFAAGYIAGVFCAIVSHPADNIVSVINKNPGTTAGQSKYFYLIQISRSKDENFDFYWNLKNWICFIDYSLELKLYVRPERLLKLKLSLERHGLVQCLYQGFGCTYHYDRYIDCSSMVHLWWCQGCPSSPTSTTTTNARVTSFEVGGTKIKCQMNIKSRLT